MSTLPCASRTANIGSVRCSRNLVARDAAPCARRRSGSRNAGRAARSADWCAPAARRMSRRRLWCSTDRPAWPTCEPRASASAARVGASSPVRINLPMMPPRSRITVSAMATMLGGGIHDGRIHAVDVGRDRRQLPVGAMRREHQRGLAVVAHLLHAAVGLVGIQQMAAAGPRRVVVPQMIEMRELGADPSEIFPDAARGFVRSPRGIFPGTQRRDWRGRVRCSGRKGPTRADQLAAEIRQPVDRNQPDRAQQYGGESADQPVARCA